MATKFANVKGIKFIEEPLGEGNTRAGALVVTFDMVGGTVYTGGSDTAQLGGGGTENGVTTALTLAQMVQNRRRDGRTVTLLQVVSGWGGAQAAATNGPDIFVQSAAVSSGNVTGNLFSAQVSGSAITTTTAAWDRAASLIVTYKATYTGNTPE